MEEKMSNLICEELIKKNTISREYKEIYVYGLEMVISLIINLIIIISVGAIVRQINETLIFVSIFMLLRRFTGGYHAKTRFKCHVYTISSYLAVIVASKIIPVSVESFVTLGCLGIFMIIKFGPIENPNKPIDTTNLLKLKIYSVIVFIILYIIAAILLCICEQFGVSLFYTLTIVIVLMIVGVAQRKGGEKDENNC